MILYIDTTEYEKVTYALVGERVVKKSYKTNTHQSSEVLSKLDDFLKKSKILNLPTGKAGLKSKIRKIVVNSGPGSFTGVRVGLSHAQALGLGWNIPVVPIPKEKVPKDLKDLK